MRPEISTALKVIESLRQERPELASNIERVLPALAINFANAGKDVTYDTLIELIEESVFTGKTLKSFFIDAANPSRNILSYDEIYKQINGHYPRWHSSFSEAVFYVRTTDIGDYIPTPNELATLPKTLETLASLGNIEAWRFVGESFFNGDVPLISALKAAGRHKQFHFIKSFHDTYLKSFAQGAPLKFKPRDYINALHYPHYRRFRELCDKFPQIPEQDLVGLEPYIDIHFDIKLKEYIKIKNILGKEVPDLRARNETAFTATILFQSEERVLQFMKRHGEQNERPLNALLSKLNPPLCPDIDWPSWGDGLLKYGMDMAFFLQFADHLESPRKNHEGKISLALTRDYLSRTAYSRKEENLELADLCFDLEVPEHVFNEALDVWNRRLDPFDWYDDSAIPDIHIGLDNMGLPDYYLKKIPYDDPRILFLGEYSGCCEKIGDYFQPTIEHAVETQESGFYVIFKKDYDESYEDEIVGHSWIWRGDKNQLVIDGFETEDYNFDSQNLAELASNIANELSSDHYKDSDITVVNIGQSGSGLNPQQYYEEARFPAPRFILGLEYWSGEFTQWEVQVLRFPVAAKPMQYPEP